MPVDNMSFRVVSFGGFNKDDVMQYIDKVNFQTKEYKEKSELTNKRLQKEITEKTEELAKTKEEKEGWNEQKEKLLAQNRDLSAKITDLEAENEKLKKTLAEKEALLQAQPQVNAQVPAQAIAPTIEINPMPIMEVNPIMPIGNDLNVSDTMNVQQPINNINAINNIPQQLNQQPLNQQPLNQQPLNQQPLNQQPLNQQPLNNIMQPTQDVSHYEEEIARLKAQLNSMKSSQDVSRYEDEIARLKVQLEQAKREKTTYEDVKDTIVKLEIEAHLRAKAIKEEAIVEGEHIIAQAHVKADALISDTQRNFQIFMSQKDRIIDETRSIVEGILQNSIKNIDKINTQFANMQKSHSDVSGDIKDFSQRICDMLDNLKDDDDVTDFKRRSDSRDFNNDRILNASDILAEIPRTEIREIREIREIEKPRETQTEPVRHESIFAQSPRISIDENNSHNIFSEQTRDLYQETPRAYDGYRETPLQENNDIFRDVGIIRDNYQDEVKMQVNDMFKESNIFKDQSTFREDTRNMHNGNL